MAGGRERKFFIRDYSRVKIGDKRHMLKLVETYVDNYKYHGCTYSDVQMGRFVCDCGDNAKYPLERVFGDIDAVSVKTCGKQSCVSKMVNASKKILAAKQARKPARVKKQVDPTKEPTSPKKAASAPKRPRLTRKPAKVLSLPSKPTSEEQNTVVATVTIFGLPLELNQGDEVSIERHEGKITVLVNGEFDCMFRV